MALLKERKLLAPCLHFLTLHTATARLQALLDGGGPLDGHPVRRLLRAALPVQRALRRHREAGHRAGARATVD